MSELPQSVVDHLEREVNGNVHATMYDSVKLFPDNDLSGDTPEFVRSVGKTLVSEYGYAITGLRSHDNHVELWLDEIDVTVNFEEGYVNV